MENLIENLIIVRHGEYNKPETTEANAKLSDFGKKQMKVLAEKIKKFIYSDNCIILSSDMGYALDSANELCNILGCEVLKYWRLRSSVDEVSIIFDKVLAYFVGDVIFVTHAEMTAELVDYLAHKIWGVQKFEVILEDDATYRRERCRELEKGEAYVIDYEKRVLYHLSALQKEKE